MSAPSGKAGKAPARPSSAAQKRPVDDDEEVDSDGDGDGDAGEAVPTKRGGKRAKVQFEEDDDEAKDDNLVFDDDDEEEFKEGSPEALAAQKEHDAKMLILLNSLSREQRDRYEKVTRARIIPNDMKKFLHALGYPISNKIVLLVMGSIAKMHCGELVEEARDIMLSSGEPEGALQPRHMREAARRLEMKGNVPCPEYNQKKLFRG